jgi:DNA-binding NtrC family response regulator
MLPDVLVVEDESTLAKNIQAYLGRQGFDVKIASTGAEGLAQFEQFKPDLVVLDYNLPDIDGLQVLSRLQAIDSRVKAVMITGEGGVEVAVSAMKAGVRDYLTKPLVLSELKILLERIAGQDRMEGVLSYYQSKEARGGGLSALIGESPPVRLLKGQIRQLVESDHRVTGASPATVLITGETGTGKELVARALHFDGPRHDQPFIEFNCAAIPTHLLESELFGYEKGAFTDARERKRGLLETAHAGTLFLDEIGDMEPTAQTKLLKVLEDRVLRRLGGLRDIPVDVRFVSASNQALEEKVRDGEFRSDLYFRLRVIELKVPPLRDRGDDVLLLADHFLAELRGRYGKPELHYGPGAKAVLRAHAWPGNIRELRNLVEQTVLLARGPAIGPSDFALSPLSSNVGARTSGEFLLPEEGVDLLEVERTLVEQALERSGGNVTSAAKLLGLTRDTLRYRIEKFGLS